MKITENKPHSIHLRLTDEQFTFCKDMSHMLGVGVSDVCRMLINTYMVTNEKLNKSMLELQLGDLANENNQNDFEH